MKTSNYSPLNLVGTVTVTSIDEDTGTVIKQETIKNTIVRTGRVAITKLITGVVSQDRSYIVTDATFPRTYDPSPDASLGWLGLSVDGEVYMFYLGPQYTANAAANETLGPVTRDAQGFAAYLNTLFSVYDGIDRVAYIPVYQRNGEIVSYIPKTTYKLVASVVSGSQQVKITRSDASVGTIDNHSTDAWARFYTDDSLFGPLTERHVAGGISTAASDYVVTGMQLGVSNGTTTILDEEFVPGTYVSDVYTPTVSYGQSDSEQAYDTQAIFEIVLPYSEGNGESGLGVVYTEAALLCRDGSWFAHVNFGNFYKNNRIRLTVRWIVDCLPQ